MTLLFSTFLVAIISAICPLVNLEVFVAGIGVVGTTTSIWSVATAAALGQSMGKLLWYQVGASAMRWKYVEKKMESTKWKRCYAGMRSRIDQRPWMGMFLVFLSAAVGLPPLAIMAVLCGQLHFNRTLFFAMTFVGRALRFATVLGGMEWVLAAR